MKDKVKSYSVCNVKVDRELYYRFKESCENRGVKIIYETSRLLEESIKKELQQ